MQAGEFSRWEVFYVTAEVKAAWDRITARYPAEAKAARKLLETNPFDTITAVGPFPRVEGFGRELTQHILPITPSVLLRFMIDETGRGVWLLGVKEFPKGFAL
jgi:hypothetical protein